MFLEHCGQFCFKKIRPSIFFSSLLVPIICATFYLFFQILELQELENRFIYSTKKGKSAIEKKRNKEQFLRRYSSYTPYFINQYIESLNFLDKEKQELITLLNHPAVLNKKILKERLSFLSGETNRLLFAEEKVRSSTKIKETEEKQRHPVQVDEKDLEKLLSLIEDVSSEPLNSPQLIIRNFQLKKKETSLRNEIFEVEMELLKREWLP